MNPTPTSTENPDTRLPSSSVISDDEISLFFGEPECQQNPADKKKRYYSIRYKEWEVNKGNYQFNWYALGGGVIWMAYRKMFSYVLYYILACLIISTVSEAYLFPDFSFLLYFVAGFFGNHLYFGFAKKSILKIRQEKLEPAAERLKIEKAGGMSVVGMIVCLVVYLVLVGV